MGFRGISLGLKVNVVSVPRRRTRARCVLSFRGGKRFLCLSSDKCKGAVLLARVVLKLSTGGTIGGLGFCLLSLKGDKVVPLGRLPRITSCVGVSRRRGVKGFRGLVLRRVGREGGGLTHTVMRGFSMCGRARPRPLGTVMVIVSRCRIVGRLNRDMRGFVRGISESNTKLNVCLTIDASESKTVEDTTEGGFGIEVNNFGFSRDRLSSFIKEDPCGLPRRRGKETLMGASDVRIVRLCAPIPFRARGRCGRGLGRLVSRVDRGSSRRGTGRVPIVPRRLAVPVLSSCPKCRGAVYGMPVKLSASALRICCLSVRRTPTFVLNGTGANGAGIVGGVLALLSSSGMCMFSGGDRRLTTCRSGRGIICTKSGDTITTALSRVGRSIFTEGRRCRRTGLSSISLDVRAFIGALPPVCMVMSVLRRLCRGMRRSGDEVSVLRRTIQCNVCMLIASRFGMGGVAEDGFVRVLLTDERILVLKGVGSRLLFDCAKIQRRGQGIRFNCCRGTNIGHGMGLVFRERVGWREAKVL